MKRILEAWAIDRRRWLCAVPVLAAIVFVLMYATAMPLTDEWFFLNGVIGLQGADLFSHDGLANVLDHFPARLSEHWVIVPFLYYWPVAQLAHFDNRWLIFTTLAVFAVEARFYRKHMVSSPLWALPIVLLLFCPSHYMEFLWGWQFTLAFSIVFALAGLVALHRMPSAPGWRLQCAWFLAGVLLFQLGTLSSTPGFLGYPCGVLLLALRPFERRARLLWTGLLALATGAVYLQWLYDPGRHLAFGLRDATYVLTALGATIWGSPVGLVEFGFDFRSATGLVILACLFAVLTRAALTGALRNQALALSFVAFGLICTATIAMARAYLGNWHLQCALPAVCGTYAAACILWRSDRSLFTAVPLFTMLMVLLACVVGWIHGFVEYGPSYNEYIRNIEDHARRVLVEPDHPRPYPGPNDLSRDMLLFLSAHHHPVFQDPKERSVTGPLPAGARVFLDETELALPATVACDGGKVAILTVVLPSDARAGGVLAQIGASPLVLRRVHSLQTQLACCAEPGASCFSGMIVSRLVGPGAQALRLSLTQ